MVLSDGFLISVNIHPRSMTQYQGKNTNVLKDKNDLIIQTYQIIKGMHVYTSHPILIFGGLNLPYIFTRKYK